MNPLLEEIDKVYIEIQPFIFPSPEYIEQLNEDEIAYHHLQHSRAAKQYESAISQLNKVISLVSSTEIIEGYIQGSRLLQQNLSGYMVQNFDSAYIPTMITAIKQDHGHTAWIFLHALAKYTGTSFTTVFIDALFSKSPQVREHALIVIEQLHLIDALPYVAVLTHDPVTTVALAAQDTLIHLQSL